VSSCAVGWQDGCVTATELPEGARRVAAKLAELGHPHEVVMLPVTGRTAADAATALGVELGQIAKSIVFRRREDDAAVLVVTSGDLRVDEKKVSALVGKLGRADADFVKAATGFSIGGVSPVAHTTQPVILIDQELFRFERVWAAAGHPYAVFPLSPDELVQLTGAPVAEIA
jgi:prolyl-tRNA editing enzyme YbaK/EbsC (Cys-tRNA(Pro) deacylase)